MGGIESFLEDKESDNKKTDDAKKAPDNGSDDELLAQEGARITCTFADEARADEAVGRVVAAGGREGRDGRQPALAAVTS